MADVTVSDGALRITLSVPERVFSLHAGSVVVPLDEITEVRVVRDILAQLRGVRMPGLGVRGRTAIGTWRGSIDDHMFHDFVVVSQAGPGVVIATSGTYDRLLVGTNDPDRLAAELGG
jgi:hypothetical protein